MSAAAMARSVFSPLKKWPGRQVDMVDVNERAMDLARRNAAANGAGNVNIFASDRYQEVFGQYAMIVTNPPIRAAKPSGPAFCQKLRAT